MLVDSSILQPNQCAIAYRSRNGALLQEQTFILLKSFLNFPKFAFIEMSLLDGLTYHFF